MNIILIATAIVVLIYNLLFFHIGFGVGTGIIFLILNFYYFFLREKQNPRNLALALTSSALSVIFALLTSWRDSGIVLAINFFSSIFFLLTAIYFYQDKSAFHFSIPRFLLTPMALFSSMLETLFGARAPRDETAGAKDHSTTVAILKGFAIALPIFLVLLLLLTQADPIFQKLTGDLFQNIGERLIVSAVVFIGLFVVALTRVKERFLNPEEIKKIVSKEKAYELIVILASLTLLFTAFIVIQFQYLFSNIDERDLAKLGVASLTYSEYVRKGFAELLAVSVIAISVLVYVMRYLHHLMANQKLSVQILASVFTIETGLILLSAAQRNILYADAHGLTRARVFGFIFLVWLGVFLLLLLAKVLAELPKKVLFNLIMAITVLSLLSFTAINIDGSIATDFKPTVNSEIDYFYLSSISADAHQSWKPAVEEINGLLAAIPADNKVSDDQRRKLAWARMTLDNLTHQLNVLEDKYAPGEIVMNKYKKDGQIPNWVKDRRNWQSFNLSQYQAYNFVLENRELFAQIPKFQERIEIIERGTFGAPVQLDRSINAPFTQNR